MLVIAAEASCEYVIIDLLLLVELFPWGYLIIVYKTKIKEAKRFALGISS